MVQSGTAVEPERALDSGRAQDAERPMRKDAQRNRDLLLSVASSLFAANGVEYPLEDIAREAGVGIGTLYRHFPTRGALIEAVYRREVAQLCDSVDDLLATLSPDAALEAWMHNFVAYVAAKRGMSAALRDMMAAEPELFAGTRAHILDAAAKILSAAVDAGAIRPVIGAEDLIRAMGAVCMATDDAAYSDRATTLVSLLLDGLRAGAPNPSK
jgi:AcrR family transcriptional regulator